MSLKLDAFFIRNSSYAPAVPTEAPVGSREKSQAGSEHMFWEHWPDISLEHMCGEALCAPGGWRLVRASVQCVCKSIDQATWLLGILNK